ncbi:phosphatidate cytidylyltransferase [Cyclospora cayetanensis]|uniref:phosphatidate cytidylyltransferase n=1 Tax=Cyclospora cayetanensis TaxID=88456 RepID=A0A1D3CZE3_9EIME|nr:phosphatidate cytidylyltransferase [Cyclospora cayetanensis]
MAQRLLGIQMSLNATAAAPLLPYVIRCGSDLEHARLSQHRLQRHSKICNNEAFHVVRAAGHSYCMVLVLSLIVAIYKEIIQAKERREEERLPDFHLLKWYWLLLTIVAIGLPWGLPRLRGVDPRTAEVVLSYHSLGVYVAWFVGFIWFILSLRKSYLRYQFSQLGVMLVVLLFVVSQSLIQIANIYSGLIWFFLPTSLVIVNDIFAYLCGTAFGRTRLIRLSPKKTVEGYLGAACVTLLWAWVVGRQLEAHPMFVCPQPYISFKPFSVIGELSCTPSPVFISRCTDTEIHRLGLSWWEDDPAVLKQQQVLQRQQLALLKEHQALTVKAAAADEQLLLLAAAAQQQDWESEPPSALPSDSQQLQPPEQHQQQHHQHQEAAIQAMRSSLVARLLALEAAREETAAAERGLCRSLFASPFDFHSMVLGSFAAFFAPFGGFFASGFKRAVRIKAFAFKTDNPIVSRMQGHLVLVLIGGFCPQQPISITLEKIEGSARGGEGAKAPIATFTLPFGTASPDVPSCEK